ncbi:MAG TPA: hypothetical protein VGE51_06095 [Fontimonas sp.]
MSAYPDWLTLREIDTRAGAAKGTAFRAFKRLEAQLQEGRDYVVFDHERDAQAIAEIKNRQRAYPSSVNLLLLHPRAAERLCNVLGGGPASSGN